MKSNILIKIGTLLLAAFVFFLPGCRNYLVPERGAVSLENARINLPEDGVNETLWEGKHLDVNYSISSKSSELVLSGTVVIHDTVLMSFDSVKQLVVKVNFLDNSGRVLGTADITPLYTAYGKVRGPLKFKTVVPLVPGTRSFTFSYFGIFIGRVDGTSGDDWEIFYFPFE